MHTIPHGMAVPLLCAMLPPILLGAQRLRRTFRKKTDAEFVRDAREKLGLTQAELGDKLGLERRTVMRYEGGITELPLHKRYALMYLLSRRRKKRGG